MRKLITKKALEDREEAKTNQEEAAEKKELEEASQAKYTVPGVETNTVNIETSFLEQMRRSGVHHGGWSGSQLREELTQRIQQQAQEYTQSQLHRVRQDVSDSMTMAMRYTYGYGDRNREGGPPALVYEEASSSWLPAWLMQLQEAAETPGVDIRVIPRPKGLPPLSGGELWIEVHTDKEDGVYLKLVVPITGVDTIWRMVSTGHDAMRQIDPRIKLLDAFNSAGLGYLFISESESENDEQPKEQNND